MAGGLSCTPITVQGIWRNKWMSHAHQRWAAAFLSLRQEMEICYPAAQEEEGLLLQIRLKSRGYSFSPSSSSSSSSSFCFPGSFVSPSCSSIRKGLTGSRECYSPLRGFHHQLLGSAHHHLQWWHPAETAGGTRPQVLSKPLYHWSKIGILKNFNTRLCRLMTTAVEMGGDERARQWQITWFYPRRCGRAHERLVRFIPSSSETDIIYETLEPVSPSSSETMLCIWLSL